jgi:trimeric autotransporter adhesin
MSQWYTSVVNYLTLWYKGYSRINRTAFVFTFVALLFLLSTFSASYALVPGPGSSTCSSVCMDVAPASGGPGNLVSVDVTGFLQGYPVSSFTFDGLTPVSQTCTSQTSALSSGAVDCNFTVPNLSDGSYKVDLTVDGQTSEGSFRITQTSYDLKFSETGLDSSAIGSIVTFSTGQFTPITVGQFTLNEGEVNSGTTITYSYSSTVPSSNSGEQFVLSSPTSPSSGFGISASTTITGSYQKQDYVQFVASPSGDGTVSSNAWYNDGSSGNAISATPNSGYLFSGWTIVCVTGSSCIAISGSSITVNGPGTLVANFVPTAPALDPTSTTIFCFAASDTSDFVGGQASCTAIVTDTASSGATAPLGVVTFSSDSSGIFGPFGTDSSEFISPSSCSLVSSSSAQSQCTLAYTPSAGSEGVNTLSGDYGGGDSAHYGSGSSFQLEIYDRQTTTSITCTPPSSGSETCTATVMDVSSYDESTPTGEVFFLTSGTGGFVSASGSTFDQAIDGTFNGCTLGALPPGQAPNTLWAGCSVTYVVGAPDEGSYVENVAVYMGDGYHLDSYSYTQAIDVDQPFTFSSYLTYAGNPPVSYSWLVSVNGGTYSDASSLCGAPISTSVQGTNYACTVPANSLTAGDTYSFELTWTDSSTPTPNSYTNILPTSTITIYPSLSVTLSPGSQQVDQGQTATISDIMSTTGAPPYTFQWLEKAPGAGSFSPATDCINSVSAVCDFVTTGSTPTGTYSFELQVTDSSPTPETQTASPVSLTVNPALAAGSISPPGGATIDLGQSISLSVSWSGGTSTYSVAWYSGNSASCASDTTPVASDSGLSMLTDSHSVSPISSTYYCAVISDSGTPAASVTFPAILVSVSPELVAGAITPPAPAIDSGLTTTLNANPSGGTTPYKISWFSGSSASCPSDTTPAGTGSSIQVSPTSNTYYCYSVTDSSQGTPSAGVSSSIDLVTVHNPLKAPTIKASPSFVLVGSTTKISVIIAFSEGTPSYTCQWLDEAPGALSFSLLSSSFLCSAGSLFSTSSGNLFKAGTWSFELQVSDSDGAVVKSAPIQVSVSHPAILLSPSSSRKAGTTVYVIGLGFVSGSKVAISFNGVIVATCVAKNRGGLLLNCSFKVPSGSIAGNTYTVTATDVYGNAASATFKFT